jgi:hypothetical protein
VDPARLRFSFLLLLLFSMAGFGQASRFTRDRSSFNTGWLFQRNDPPGARDELDYEKVKSQMLVSGRRNTGTERTARPNENIGQNVAYTSVSSTTRRGEKLDLPHDWAIEGDFQQPLPGDIGKRPFSGVGWYRKHFNVPVSDKGKQIYIDFDGAMAYRKSGSTENLSVVGHTATLRFDST